MSVVINLVLALLLTLPKPSGSMSSAPVAVLTSPTTTLQLYRNSANKSASGAESEREDAAMIKLPWGVAMFTLGGILIGQDHTEVNRFLIDQLMVKEESVARIQSDLQSLLKEIRADESSRAQVTTATDGTMRIVLDTNHAYYHQTLQRVTRIFKRHIDQRVMGAIAMALELQHRGDEGLLRIRPGRIQLERRLDDPRSFEVRASDVEHPIAVISADGDKTRWSHLVERLQ